MAKTKEAEKTPSWGQERIVTSVLDPVPNERLSFQRPQTSDLEAQHKFGPGTFG